MQGDPHPEGLGTRYFLNNVGGNGGGDGCCSGTTAYFVVTQEHPGAPFVEPSDGPGQRMLDYGAFTPKAAAKRAAGARGLALLQGTSSRGLSMARVLGSDLTDHVTRSAKPRSRWRLSLCRVHVYYCVLCFLKAVM